MVFVVPRFRCEQMQCSFHPCGVGTGLAKGPDFRGLGGRRYCLCFLGSVDYLVANLGTNDYDESFLRD